MLIAIIAIFSNDLDMLLGLLSGSELFDTQTIVLPNLERKIIRSENQEGQKAGNIYSSMIRDTKCPGFLKQQ